MGYGNETSSYGPGRFTHYTKYMPEDQKQKLIAMHQSGRATAGIYVAVVLSVYVVLLTILLCRYTRRQRPSESQTQGGQTNISSGFLGFATSKWGCSRRGIFRCLCSNSCCPPNTQTDEAVHEIADYSNSPIQTNIDSSPSKPTCV